MESKQNAFFGFLKTAVDIVRILVLAMGVVIVLGLLYSAALPGSFGRIAWSTIRLEFKDPGVVTLRQGTLPDAGGRVVVSSVRYESHNPGIARLFLVRNLLLMAGFFFFLSLARTILCDARKDLLRQGANRLRIRYLGYSLIAAAPILTFMNMAFGALTHLRLSLKGVMVSFSPSPQIVLIATGAAVLILAAAFEQSMA